MDDLAVAILCIAGWFFIGLVIDTIFFRKIRQEKGEKGDDSRNGIVK